MYFNGTELTNMFFNGVEMASSTTTSVTVYPKNITFGNTLSGYYKALDQFDSDITALCTWESADPAIVSIDSTALATALSTGTTQITALLTSNPAIKNTTNVTIDNSSSNNAFEATLTVSKAGTSNIRILTNGNVDLSINWGAGPILYNNVTSGTKFNEVLAPGATVQITCPNAVNYITSIDFQGSVYDYSTDLYDTIAITKSSGLTSMNGITGYSNQLTSFTIADTSNVTSTLYAFKNCYELITLSSMDLSSVTNFTQMFFGASKIRHINMITSDVGIKYERLFTSCVALECVGGNLDTTNNTSSVDMFGNTPALTTPDSVDRLAITTIPGINWVNPGSCP